MKKVLVTKSVRLAATESAALVELAERLRCSQASLLARFVSDGLREALLGEAIRSYGRGTATAAEAARIAHLPESEFDEQLRQRGILEPGGLAGESGGDAELFWSRQVGEALGSDRLLQLVHRLQADGERGKPAGA